MIVRAVFKLLLKSLALLFILLAISVAVFVFMARQKPTLNEESRNSVSGSFAYLSDGRTYYEVHGPEDGEVILAIHGSTIYNIIWERNIEAWTESGFRVVVYDQYGRGYSDRPRVAYTGDLYLRQIEELLSYLEIDAPLHLVGISMGGAMATLFAANNPDRILSMSYIASVNPGLVDKRVGDILSGVERRLSRRLQGGESLEERMSRIAPLYEKSRQQFIYRGVEWAFFSAIWNRREFPFAQSFRKVSEQRFPTVVLWGDEDSVVPLSTSDEFLLWIPHGELHVIEGGGHQLNWEKSEEVNRILLDFWRSL